MKSDKHIELSRKALTWLRGRCTGRGVRGCEEVVLTDGYVADAAAICGLQLTHERIMTGNAHKNRLSQEAADDYSWVFETKVSRSDFNNTFKHGKHLGDRLKPIGNFHFVVTTKGLILSDEVPTFWGLLEESGQGLAVKKLPIFQPTEPADLFKFAYKVLRYGHDRKFTLEVNEQYCIGPLPDTY